MGSWGSGVIQGGPQSLRERVHLAQAEHRGMKLRCALIVLALGTGLAAKPVDPIQALGSSAARLRHLKYTPILAQRVSQQECAAYVRRILHEESKPKDELRWDRFLKQLHLIPNAGSFAQTRETLLMDQIRGLYDPKQKRYLVVKGSESKGLEKMMGGMMAMMGIKMEDVFTVHELDHAIQDQHFSIQSIEKRVGSDFDRQLAAQSLLEGDATAVMTDYIMDLTGQSVDNRPPEAPGRSEFFGSPAIDKAPRFLKESLTFPYLQGQFFVETLRWNEGWEGVNRAYKNLPQSSEQIMHPQKYPKERPQPVTLKLTVLPGYRSLGQDTAGEFTVRCWAREHNKGANVSSGWGGDRFEVCDGPGGAYVVWATVWDSPADAKEFADFATQVLSKKGPPSRAGGLSRWKRDALKHQGRSVTVWINLPPKYPL